MILYDFCEQIQKSTLPGGFKRGPHEKKQRFSEGVQKEEIQQWRHTRSGPGEKETLNIMLREKKMYSWIYKKPAKYTQNVHYTRTRKP